MLRLIMSYIHISQHGAQGVSVSSETLAGLVEAGYWLHLFKKHEFTYAYI